jgi:hypothetical protein
VEQSVFGIHRLIQVRWQDHARMWIALLSAIVLVSALGAFAKPQQRLPPVEPAIQQAIINTQEADRLDAITERLAKIDDLHLERVLGVVDSLAKVDYAIVAVLLANLVGTIFQIRGQSRSERRR